MHIVIIKNGNEVSSWIVKYDVDVLNIYSSIYYSTCMHGIHPNNDTSIWLTQSAWGAC